MASKAPQVELSECSLCGSCLEVAPQVFSQNPAGYIEVTELPRYPEDMVNEAIALCPADCITWEE